MSRVTPRRGFTGAVLGALTVVLVGSGGVCRPARAAVASTPSADWQVAVTPAVGIGGLDAEHQVIVTNLGPDEATNVQISDLLSSVTPSGGKEHMLSATSSQGTCSDTVRPATDLVNCQIGNVAAGQTVTVTVDTKMPPDANTGFASHLGEVTTDTWGPDLFHLSASALATWPSRFWFGAYEEAFSDGYVLREVGFTVTADDVVHFPDGSVVRRDGILARADGKFVLPDRTVTSVDPDPAGGGSGGGGGGGGGSDSVPNLNVTFTAATTTTPAPGTEDDFTVTVKNTGGAGSLLTHLVITLPSTLALAGPPAYLIGSGCTGTTTIDCDLDYIPNGGSTTIRFGVTVGGSGSQTISASATSDREADPSDNTAAETLVISVSPAAKPAPAPAPAGHVIHGTPGPDHLSGTAGPDVIYGGAGNDTLTGGLGRDHIYGGRGNDTIFARDGQRDVIDCGPGRDVVYADKHDVVAKNCETVHRT